MNARVDRHLAAPKRAQEVGARASISAPARALFVALVGALAIACADGSPPSDLRRTRVTIGGAEISAEVARARADKQRGLGGRAGLAPEAGMLFVFDRPERHTFWMLDMQFALDFVWIRGDRVVDLSADVPPPPSGVEVASGLLRLVEPKEPVDLVLEVAAGSIAKYGWKIGDTVALDPSPR